MAVTCDKNIVQALPCLKCESPKELLALDALAWAKANGLSIDTVSGLNSALAASACMECLSDKQITEGVVAVELNKFDNLTDSMSVKRAKVNGLVNTAEHRIKALILYLKCLYWKTH